MYERYKTDILNQLSFLEISALMWKIYSGSKKSTRQSAAVFVLEKRALEARYPDKLDREAILEQCRKAVAQLTRLKHPQVLTVQVSLRGF
jgi:SCY1-like protein 2